VVDFDKDFHLAKGLIIGCIAERRPTALSGKSSGLPK
jgi:hypothetical protein